MARLTWAALDVDADERSALRRAGLSPGDLARLLGAEVAERSGGAVDHQRADELCRRATLLELATPAKVADLERAGVRDRADLASREPDDLFRAWVDTSPYSGPAAHDLVAALIHAARGEVRGRATAAWWRAERQRTGFDPVRLAWRHRFGGTTEPWPTAGRLRIPSVRVDAPVAEAGPASGGEATPLPPLRPGDVTRLFSIRRPPVTTVVGHWVWGGRRGAFFGLETLVAGAAVELRAGGSDAGDPAAGAYEVLDVRLAVAPVELDVPEGGLLLLTPPHRRWAPWFARWDLPPATDTGRLWVQTAAACAPR